ncbi:hypothetical protein AM1BK_32110 [Neobacillus kokaensis]|uniref:HTH merR-type domain-containing protein n=1 Tax=Neobacillus kokaensis TaxID=2759023 RepID=A0ABQ3N3Z9_9BACI|nr:hypothetical protein AM1BK_32110 [Neobacillus kokaensis]
MFRIARRYDLCIINLKTLLLIEKEVHMRSNIQPNEQAFSTKEGAEKVGIAAPTVKKV